MAQILLVDDDAAFLNATHELLGLLGHQVVCAKSVAEGFLAVEKQVFTHVFLDLILPDGSGLHILEGLKGSNVDAKIILVTGHPSVKSIVKDLYGPKITYLTKPIDLEQIQAVLAPPNADMNSSVATHFKWLVGESPAMQQLYRMIERVASANANVLLMGESGVGKEMVAAAIHEASKPKGDFVPANCGAFSHELIGSELFGHEKGAFTGATHRKPGVFELANEGTLFLDEITEMPIDLQPNLLRVLETRKVTRLGATSSIDVQCRVVSATNRTEADIVENNLLREDLYFRLAVFPIRIAPLRERKEDIPLLVEHFLHIFNRDYGSNVGIRDEDMERLMHHDWPGNVRELRHALHRGFIMAESSKNVIQLPAELASPFSRSVQHKDKGITVGKTVEDVERELIETTLNHLGGDKKKAADMLGISLKTLYNRLNSYSP